MNKLVSACVAFGALTLFAGTGVQAQSTYSNTVMSLNPVAYWPLTETVAPSAAGMYVATNLGSAQAAGTGYYETWWTNVASGYALTNVNNTVHAAGAIQGDSDTAMQIGGAGQYLVWPRSTNGVANSAVTIAPPYSIEMWVYVPTVPTGLKSLFAEGGNLVEDPAFANAIAQEGIEIGMNTSHFYFKTYNGPGGTGTSLATTTGQVTANAWYHLVFTCDGTNKVAYVNTKAVTQTLTAKNSLGQVYKTDLVSPMMLGNGNELGAGSSAPLTGDVDEFAIYTNVLSATVVMNHYMAGTNPAPATSYKQTVLNDNPTIYARLDEPSFTGPSLASLPVATNYGSLGASANGLYQPGTAPGAAGPAYGGFGSSSYAVAINGFNGGVDVGGGALPSALNPTGNQPLTVMTWFRGNPADAGPRFQDLVSHGTNSYRLGLDATPGNFFNPGAGPQLAFANNAQMQSLGLDLNDGQWHMAAGVSDGTNDYLYLDGALAISGTSVASISGNPQDLILGGDPFFLGPLPGATAGYRGGLFYDGSIAQVAYFTNALTTVQIQQLYNAAGIPLSIATQPQSVTNSAGLSVTVTVVVRGSTPIYQWYSTNVNTSVVAPVADQTNASLVFDPLDLTNAGYYFVIATNSYSSVTSSVAQVTVISAPTILQQSPTNIEVFAGTAPALQVTILGAPPLTYQWSSNGVAIGGATLAAYNPSTAAIGTNLYSCVITNIYGAVTNAPNAVAVLTDPTNPYPVRVLADSPVAYFRLDEPSGTTAYDYVGGNNATYTNVVLGYTSGYSPTEDPNEGTAEFGDNPPNDYAGNVPSYLNFGTNTGNGEFSVEAWVTQFSGGSSNAIVTLGYGGGGNQFDLDAGGSTNTLRFTVTDATGVAHTAGSSRSIAFDGLWHHVVGVCDETNGHIYLYLDGFSIGSATILAGSGILASTIPLSIGAREGANYNPVNYDYQLIGQINDVAIYNQALSAAQVQNHYYSAAVVMDVPPIANPDSYTVNENTTNTFAVTTNDVVQTQGGYLTVIGVSPTNGVANIANGTNVVFTPANNFTGTATIGYTITDNMGGTNTSLVTVTVLSVTPVTINAQFAGGNITLSGTGGTAGATYYVVGSTNVALPMASWTVLSTNTFDGSGNFSVGVPVVTSKQAQFLRIKQ